MGARRKAREIVLQALYYIDNLCFDRNEAWKKATSRIKAGKSVLQYALSLFQGIKEEKEKIDKIINTYAKDWEIDRMNIVDRNIMRVGIYEILFEKIPYKVAIDEAVELAKKYSTERGKKFINGILDKVVKEQLGG